MARRKSVLGQLVKAYEQRQKVREAEERRVAAEERRAAAQEQRRERAEAAGLKQQQDRQAAERRERQRREAEARREARAREAAERKAQQDLARIRQEAARREGRREREKEQQTAAAARQARLQEAESKTELAAERTEGLRARVEALEAVLAVRWREHDLADCRTAVAEHFEVSGTQGVEENVALVLGHPFSQGGERTPCRVLYADEQRLLNVEFELPPQSVVPALAGYRYVKSRDELVPQPRKESEVKGIYGRLIARTALRILDQAFATTPAGLVDGVVFSGYVSAVDPATGRRERLCLISVEAGRAEFAQLELDAPELDPMLCLRRMNAIVSPHPYDLEPVRPVVEFDLSRHRFVDGIDVVAGMDSRHDLLTLSPGEFEHLVRRLFEAAGMRAWVTQHSKDDGVDAVAVIEEPLMSMKAVIQAKRWTKVVTLESVHALAGVMEDMNAGKGTLVTTSWFGKASRDFARRHGRMELIDGRELKAMIREHLGLDVLIGLPKLPPGWEQRDIT